MQEITGPGAADKIGSLERGKSADVVIWSGHPFAPDTVVEYVFVNGREVYRRPYLEAGESRRPTLTWPREIPIDGEPADMVALIADVGQWMATNDLPKLFIHADPGAILQGAQLDFCRTFANQREVDVEGTHFIQEEQPAAISAALADWYATL